LSKSTLKLNEKKMKEELLQRIATCIEFGKINKAAPYPPELKGQDGADELTKQALEEGVSPGDILNLALIAGMEKVGQKFSERKIFVPQMLIAAKAMNAAMQHMKPYFSSGDLKRKGTFVIGTVLGDLHDIGKNLVAMMIEGSGWEVIDLGVDVKSTKFIDAIEKNPGCVIGLSALLTTTMVNMETTVKEIREKYPNTTILVGGSPVSTEFCEKIGATFYSPNPQGAVEYLKNIAA
jgi:methanogenic corrinoid protein MtbC1